MSLDEASKEEYLTIAASIRVARPPRLEKDTVDLLFGKSTPMATGAEAGTRILAAALVVVAAVMPIMVPKGLPGEELHQDMEAVWSAMLQ